MKQALTFIHLFHWTVKEFTWSTQQATTVK